MPDNKKLADFQNTFKRLLNQLINFSADEKASKAVIKRILIGLDLQETFTTVVECWSEDDISLARHTF